MFAAGIQSCTVGLARMAHRGEITMQNPSQRIALVTGANKGIGFEIARQIGLTGVMVLVGARNKAAGINPDSRCNTSLQSRRARSHFPSVANNLAQLK